MKMALWALLLSAGMLVVACGGGEADDTREVERPARTHGVFPIEATDDALRTEATTAMGVIYRRIQQVLITEQDREALFRDLEGPLNDAALRRLGVDAGTLTGTWYKPSDYRLQFSGNELTITAGQPGSRGYKQSSYPLR
jgi:hypothetical protein